jgi:hypothetical protein
MNVIVPLFLLAPLVIVPFGYRLLEVASPGSRPPSIALAAVLPAAAFLVVSFVLAPGLAAAVLALPWVAVTGWVAATAAIRRLRDPARFRPSVGHATDAAAVFLAIGATFALTDRLGARPFDFPSTVILLTAVHFHYAGFALPLAGALAFTRRPRRSLEVALGAVVVGIPVTALGFFGFPIANWVGAVLTASGGFAIGLATIAVARGLAVRAAVVLAVIAGTSLLVSMPLAIVYATGTLLGTAWLPIDLMARVHGSLNALGFALPVIAAWTLDVRSRTSRAERRPKWMTRSQLWATGVVTGVVVGIGVPIGGFMAGALGLAAVLLIALRPPRNAPVGGLMLGFGSVWLVMFGTAGVSCSIDCVGPDLRPWVAAGLVMLGFGIILTARAFRSEPRLVIR